MFKVGDRVFIKKYSPEPLEIIEKVATIVEITNGFAGLEYDFDIKGHGCDGKAKYGYGWYVSLKDIQLDKKNNVRCW